MSIFNNIGRFGAALRMARRNRLAMREMNALPPELQKDIGWPASPESRTATSIREIYLKALT
ncbi:hypothetical protein RB623_02870 [Mesorhizobium sp. LHD-90]|uniref:hypothetical protein n=1 Tax=Mesorhizobium sp. LHD-90 TaxID=3071414 RepID=UPI0027DF408D|nr:hypothetical protein [Mesorhizobium sp. LHD-90]MDQ6432996.1 hypothetical protein [Mesorhizobium sp. LHD-90]